MKVQELAIIFVIIILPISIVISAYTQGQIKTINTQSVYDAKLTSATYDAIKAFQINTANDTGSDLANSKLNDIENSVKTFKSSIISSFGLNGYAEEEMDNYIPALVYTLYDGFYIYSPYENVNYQYDDENNPIDGNGENLFGLKPYISYSCRYKASTSKGDVDVVITYALDNYVSVQGTVNEKYINDSGYLIDGIEDPGEDEKNYKIKYRGIEIKDEKISEYLPVVGVNGETTKSYPYVKINGTKYYNIGNKIVYLTNDGIKVQVTAESNPEEFSQWLGLIENNRMAREYYYEAYHFTERFKEYGLGELEFQHAYSEVIKENGNVETEQLWENDTRKVFDFNTDWKWEGAFENNIENESSNFNEHRLAVIRNKIETNLAIAVANFNEYSGTGSTNEFQMPELKEDEWKYITHNISLISFLQGLNIGGKKYNGYTIVTNSESKEVVLEEYIYILGEKEGKKEYYRVGDKGFEDGTITIASDFGGGNKNSAGRLNLDFKRKKSINGATSIYYYPLSSPIKDDSGELSYFDASYSSIVMRDNVKTYEDIYKYIDSHSNEKLKEAFYTALARERYGVYKTFIVNVDEITKNMPIVTITYNLNGGENATQMQVKLKDETAVLAGAPEREGYTFVEWNTDQNGGGISYKAGDTYGGYEDIILYAIWEKIELNVIYYPGSDGVTKMPDPTIRKVKWGEEHKIDEAKPELEGHTFGGWTTDPNLNKTFGKYGYGTGQTRKITNITDNIYLYATWIPDTYTITYNVNGGTGTPGSQTKTYGVGLTLSYIKPTREGYTFVEWNTDPNGGGTSYNAGDTYTENKSVTLYAIWNKITYTVSYNANGGSGAPGNQTKIYGVDLKLATEIPTREGWEFKNWNTKQDGTGTSYNPGGTYKNNSNVTLYAIWNKKYTVSYNANGGSGAPDSQIKIHGVDLTLSSTKPTKTGWTFVNWNTKQDGTGTSYNPGGTYKDNSSVTLYAIFKVSTYTVSYIANGGTGAPGNQTKTYGVDLTLSSTKPTKTGSTFVNWNTKADGTGTSYNPGGTYKNNSNVTLYAVWKLNTYTVAYNANGGTGAPGSQTKTYGVDLTLSSTKPKKEISTSTKWTEYINKKVNDSGTHGATAKYTFINWNAKADGTGTSYNPGGKYTANSNVTLYAKWGNLVELTGKTPCDFWNNEKPVIKVEFGRSFSKVPKVTYTVKNYENYHGAKIEIKNITTTGFEIHGTGGGNGEDYLGNSMMCNWTATIN